MANWISVTDDDGTGLVGTIINLAMTDAIRAYVDQPDGAAYIFNPAKADWDFTVKAVGVDNALLVEGDDGAVTMGVSLAVPAIEATSLKAHGNGVIEGDTTGGRVLRRIRLRILNGTNANTLNVTADNRWNGDGIAATNNIAKGSTTGSFGLSAAGDTLRVEASGLSGNVLMVFANCGYNTGGTDFKLTGKNESNDIYLQISNITTGAVIDMTALVDVGEFHLEVLYITDE